VHGTRDHLFGYLRQEREGRGPPQLQSAMSVLGLSQHAVLELRHCHNAQLILDPCKAYIDVNGWWLDPMRKVMKM
jgi:hypothetical protein